MLCAGAAGAARDAEKGEATKLKRAGQYFACRLKAGATAAKKREEPDFSKCDSKFSQKWMDAETKAGGMCPTTRDKTDIQNQVTADADLIGLKLTGTRFIDNGDGTVTDTQTGLMWEKKTSLDSTSNASDPHDRTIRTPGVPPVPAARRTERPSPIPSRR